MEEHAGLLLAQTATNYVNSGTRLFNGMILIDDGLEICRTCVNV